MSILRHIPLLGGLLDNTVGKVLDNTVGKVIEKTPLGMIGNLISKGLDANSNAKKSEEALANVAKLIKNEGVLNQDMELTNKIVKEVLDFGQKKDLSSPLSSINNPLWK
jgi:hypothetical protein